MRRLTAFVAFVVSIIASPTLAAPDWNGTWAGNWGGAAQQGVQLIMAGNVVIGIYWHGDYLPDEMKSTVSPDGRVLTVTWKDGGATQTRDGASTAKFQIHDASGSTSGELKRDR